MTRHPYLATRFLCSISLALALAVSPAGIGASSGDVGQVAPELPPQWTDLRPQSPALGELVPVAARASRAVSFWVGYEFPLRPGVSIGCGCDGQHSFGFDDGDRIVLPRRRRQDGEPESWSDECDRPFGVFMKVEGDRWRDVVRVRLVTWARAAEFNEPVMWAGLYDADESVRFLRRAILEAESDLAPTMSIKVRERLLMAVALHDTYLAPEVAIAALEAGEHAELRESAVMWAASIGGSVAIDRLLDLAKHEEDTDVRESSIFWLGQLAGDAATATLVEIAESDPLSDVRRAAVFALSQSEDEAAIDALIEIVREHRDPEVVRAALFWLGESGDERAIALFEELLIGHDLQ